jgi:hypothetical protein
VEKWSSEVVISEAMSSGMVWSGKGVFELGKLVVFASRGAA